MNESEPGDTVPFLALNDDPSELRNDLLLRPSINQALLVQDCVAYSSWTIIIVSEQIVFGKNNT